MVNQPQLSPLTGVPMGPPECATALPQEACVGNRARRLPPSSPAQFQRRLSWTALPCPPGSTAQSPGPASPAPDCPPRFPPPGFPASCLLAAANHRAPPAPPPHGSRAAPCVTGSSLMKKGCVSLITVAVSENTSELIYLLSLGKTRSSIKKFTFLLPVAIKEPVLF